MTTDQKIFLTLCGAGAAVLLLCKKRDGALGALPDGQKILRTQKQIAEIWDAGENGDASDDIIFRDGVAVFSGRLRATAKDAGLELPVESSKKKDIRAAFRVLKSLDGGGLWRHNGESAQSRQKKKRERKATPAPAPSPSPSPSPAPTPSSFVPFRESEKALEFKLKGVFEIIPQYSFNSAPSSLTKTISIDRMVWVPKKLLTPAGVPNKWITEKKIKEIEDDAPPIRGGRISEPLAGVWIDKNGREVKISLSLFSNRAGGNSGASPKQKEWMQKTYWATRKGLKGARFGLKTETLDKIIKESGFDPKTFVTKMVSENKTQIRPAYINSWAERLLKLMGETPQKGKEEEKIKELGYLNITDFINKNIKDVTGVEPNAIIWAA